MCNKQGRPMYYIEVVSVIVVRDLGKKVFFLSLIRKRWASWGEGESKGLCARGLSMSRMTTMIAICFFFVFCFCFARNYNLVLDFETPRLWNRKIAAATKKSTPLWDESSELLCVVSHYHEDIQWLNDLRYPYVACEKAGLTRKWPGFLFLPWNRG